MTVRLSDLDHRLWLCDPRRKQRYVTAMFEIIAPSYDRFTRAFSFGMDAGWKRAVIAAAAACPGQHARALDLASGTGDLAFALAERAGFATVRGIDAAPGMVALAERRRGDRAEARVSFSVGDMMALDLADASLDLVTIGYGLRNAPDLAGALREIARVLSPGGHLISLDFVRPDRRLWRALFLAYLRTMGDLYGWLWHRDPAVYGYIARSIALFVTRRQLVDAMRASGFAVVDERSWLLGGVCMQVARRG